MSRISREYLEAINSMEPQFPEEADFTELKNFYQEMIDEGLVIKQEYNLPLLDTIGRRLHQQGHGTVRT